MPNSRRSHRPPRRSLVARPLVLAGTAAGLAVALGLTAWLQGWPPFGSRSVSTSVARAGADAPSPTASDPSGAVLGTGAATSAPAGTGTATSTATGTATATATATKGTASPGGRVTATVPGLPRGGRTVVVAAVGDSACDPASSAWNNGAGQAMRCREQAVADQIAAANPAAFLALGDNQYEDGTLAAFRTSYDKAFGRFGSITHPVVGNHEYHTSGAAGYFDYFGSRAGPRGKGWYSVDIGAWHVVALNANCGEVSCAAGGEQERWLRADLAAHPTRCTLAMWHQPRWSSGSEHGDSTSTDALVRALYDNHVDVLLSGHDHDYERFAPQNPSGGLDRARGVRQFVAGAGGKLLYTVAGETNTEARNDTGFGALFLTLGPSSYSWRYSNAVGGRYSDAGTTACH